MGVVTSQAPVPSTASMWSWSSGASEATADVTSTTSGPWARRARAASTISSMVDASRPVRKFSSKWFGVTRSVRGITASRICSGSPGMTKKPRSTSPITGSQQYTAPGLCSLITRTDSAIRALMAGAPWKPESTASTSSRKPRPAMPSTTSPTWSGVSRGPLGAP